MRAPLHERDPEIAARLKESTRKMIIARDAIVKHCGGPWKKGMPDKNGSIDCPVCLTGTLYFARSAYNGHIHAGCTTEGCARWME